LLVHEYRSNGKRYQNGEEHGSEDDKEEGHLGYLGYLGYAPYPLAPQLNCKNWYSISRTASDSVAHRGNTDDRSVRAFTVKPRAFGAAGRRWGLTARRGQANLATMLQSVPNDARQY
jgi:hypothetical protein